MCPAWFLTWSCIVMSLLHTATTVKLRCKWSNEDCSQNDECCSGSCMRLHEGAGPRCGKSPLYKPCFAYYQCENGLNCGDNHTCCSPFWGVCTSTEDCCDPEYVCREEDGFIYMRCLRAGASGHVILPSYSARVALVPVAVSAVAVRVIAALTL